MTTYAWPTRDGFTPTSFDLWLVDNDLVTRSVLGGGQQTAGVPGGHWRASMSFPAGDYSTRQDLLGFLRGLNGKEHRVQLWDMRKTGAGDVVGYPLGTIQTTGVQIKTTVAQFGTSVVFKGCGNGGTLAPGDMWSVNGQLVENNATCTADGSGDMTVAVPQRLRAQAAANAAVTLIKPYALFVLAEPFHGPRNGLLYEPFAVEFEEVFS